MPLSDPALIAEDRTHPRIVDLWFALQPLRSVIGFMQSGAHPDDETSAMMAALGFRDGLSLSYCCSTRGEGGQNDIGTEATEDLGALRTAEMEAAARVLSMRLYWHSTSAEDSLFDFGFSKSGTETLGHWGRDRTLMRFVEIVRAERPDILCPTFLDVPGQHGHHRAMTEMAHEVMAAAADPKVPGGAPWQISKLFLPAWSGAGQAYDDDLPPPPATTVVAGKGVDPVTGWSYARIGEQSRAYHKTQGMGRWIPAGAERDFPLHLAESHVSGAGLTDGLPGLADLAEGALAAPLHRADAACREAIDAFPSGPAIAAAAFAAHAAITEALEICPPEIHHRLLRKSRELARVIRLAAGAEARAHLDRDWLRPGETAALTVEKRQGTLDRLETHLTAPEGWEATADSLTPGPEAAPSDPYRAAYDPLDPPNPALVLSMTGQGQTVETRTELTVPPVLLPAPSASLSPDRAVLNTARPLRPLPLTLRDTFPAKAGPDLETPEGWAVTAAESGLLLTPPLDMTPGLYSFPLRLDGTPAQSLTRIAHPHIPPRAQFAPAILRLRAVHAELPSRRIAYLGAGNDRVDHWLTELGTEIHSLDDSELLDFTPYDTLVIGIFALRFRPAIAEAMPRIHVWVHAGGTLLTLYHRPWDNWDPATTPPKPLEIGQPSLRWRVTDAEATVTHLVPDHPLLNTPNPIGPEDWAGWHKERGLYFAKSWDPAYTPLLEMADPGEAPHQGALLTAEIGQGRHTHTSLILHHQMEKLTPGAFRLMANLIA